MIEITIPVRSACDLAASIKSQLDSEFEALDLNNPGEMSDTSLEVASRYAAALSGVFEALRGADRSDQDV